MLKTISALKARKNLGEVLEEVFYKRDHFIIKRGNKPMAAIISIPEYQAFRRQQDKGFNLSARIAEKNTPVLPTRTKRETKQVKDDVPVTTKIKNHIPGSDVY